MKNQDLSRRKFINTIGTAALALPIAKNFSYTNKFHQKNLELKKINNEPKRNIIFILSDDHRYDFMSFMGKPDFLQTPNLDKMANEGAHFENAFVTTSLCSPSRASILTGKYTHRHKVVDNDTPMPNDITFFSEYLQKAGYETAFIGKWHMGNVDDNPQKGFDKWISFKGQGVYYNPELNIDGKKITKEGYITEILTDYAIEWLNQKHTKPFFLFLSHKAVHSEFEPAKKYLDKFKNIKIDYPISFANSKENYRTKPNWVKEQRNSWHGVDFMYHGAMEFDVFYRRYCETLLSLDENIGRVLKSLDDSGLSKSTIVFYTSDNGFSLGEHGLIDKRQMYEESVRIPLLAYAPGFIQPKTKIKQLVQNIDFAPSILEIAGLKAPDDMDGKSFFPILKGENIPWRDEIFYEYYWERPFPQTPTMFGIRNNKYKYVTYYGIWDIDELYDIENDLNEMNNLIVDSKYENLKKELNKKIYDWLEKTDGMQIPLKRDIFWQANLRKPK
ncbi:MAG: sulfatase [Ignavibacterium sp.]